MFVDLLFLGTLLGGLGGGMGGTGYKDEDKGVDGFFVLYEWDVHVGNRLCNLYYKIRGSCCKAYSGDCV